MAHANAIRLPDGDARLRLTSYDTGFEHSFEHWMEVRHLVEEAENEPPAKLKPVHSHGILSVA